MNPSLTDFLEQQFRADHDDSSDFCDCGICNPMTALNVVNELSIGTILTSIAYQISEHGLDFENMVQFRERPLRHLVKTASEWNLTPEQAAMAMLHFASCALLEANNNDSEEE